MELFVEVAKELNSFIEGEVVTDQDTIDPEPALIDIEEEYGTEGLKIALEYFEEMNIMTHRSVLNQQKPYSKVQIKDLDELFEEEKLDSFIGSYFDQRFINYLYEQIDRVDDIHWRKFEGLTGEFFERAGFHVDVSDPRGDDGVDVRVWPDEDDENLPPAIIIQCKCNSEDNKVEKGVVKALWHDVYHEPAESGLVVTTSSLLPGAQDVCEARNYQIQEADRDTVKQWINSMREPMSGVFLAE